MLVVGEEEEARVSQDYQVGLASVGRRDTQS
jgi:hypothetical protein